MKPGIASARFEETSGRYYETASYNHPRPLLLKEGRIAIRCNDLSALFRGLLGEKTMLFR
jgi:hypothetical protein